MSIDVNALNAEEKVKNITEEQAERFLDFVFSDDMKIYEKEVMPLSVDEQVKYFEDNPEFMADYAITRSREGIELLKNDEMFRKILCRIKQNQDADKDKEKRD